MKETPSIKFGLGVPNGGDFADPGLLMEIAVDAEQAGWDGVFLWDHLIRRSPWQPMVDPWVALAGMAVATETIVLGPMVTALARRRVAVVARQTVTLDHLSNGRLRLGVGLGAPDDEFTRFGENADPRHRAEILDESIDLLRKLWSGEPVDHAGTHLTATDVQFTPRPINGTIPIWVGGLWPGGPPFRRAARLDGVWPSTGPSRSLDVAAFLDCMAYVQAQRSAADATGPFDACFVNHRNGSIDSSAPEDLERLSAGGMTWFIESLDEPTVAFAAHRDRVRQGPPRS